MEPERTGSICFCRHFFYIRSIQRLTLPALFFLLTLCSCKKDGGDDTPGSDVPYILTSFRIVDERGDNTFKFEFDADDRPIEVRKLAQGTTTVSSVKFFYDVNGRLTNSAGYNGQPTGTPFETTNYTYDQDGQLIEENTVQTSGSCFYCNHQYAYDNEGRLSKYTRANWSRSFEYDENDNPVESYNKPLNESGSVEHEFQKFDKKNPFFGVDSTMRIIVRSMFWSELFWSDQDPWTNDFTYPVPAWNNNALKLTWTPKYHPQLVSIKRTLTANYDYNQDGYPVKATIRYSKQFQYSEDIVWTVYVTYRKLEP